MGAGSPVLEDRIDSFSVRNLATKKLFQNRNRPVETFDQLSSKNTVPDTESMSRETVLALTSISALDTVPVPGLDLSFPCHFG